MNPLTSRIFPFVRTSFQINQWQYIRLNSLKHATQETNDAQQFKWHQDDVDNNNSVVFLFILSALHLWWETFECARPTLSLFDHKCVQSHPRLRDDLSTLLSAFPFECVSSSARRMESTKGWKSEFCIPVSLSSLHVNMPVRPKGGN